MNFLAHAYLSFGDPDLLAGNLFCDFIKGKKQFSFPEKIQRGFALHRAIDAFTDQHEASAIARQVFKPSVRLYSGAFVDVAYDHFLALDTNEMSEEELKVFAKNTYEQLSKSKALFPKTFSRIFPIMRLQNWLYNYRHEWLIRNSFHTLGFRATYLSFGNSHKAYKAFIQKYDLLKQCYQQFFPELKAYAQDFIKNELGEVEISKKM